MTGVNTSWSGDRHTFSHTMRRAILRRDPICRHCGAAAASEADHIVPHAEGGDDTLANGQGLCSPCHADKTRLEKIRGQRRWRALQRRPVEPHPGLKNR